MTTPFHQSSAEAVDTEMLLMVDISRPGMSNTNFNQLLNGYSTAFRSSEVLNAIQSGANGKIAVAVMFFGNSGYQELVLPWMSISGSDDATQFGNLVEDLDRPFHLALSNPNAALDAALEVFGEETGGGSGNGFESDLQVIEIAAGGIPTSSGGGGGGSHALASGVDLINSISVGIFATIFENYYVQNVIGSEIPGVEPTSSTAMTGSAITNAISESVSNSTNAGAQQSQAMAVPEPGSALLVMLGAACGCLRRRRQG
ncbi:MAG: DUF1194 domain-containing protein [Akkermansiaceae bacterium]|jgi:hypothetical protein|nr:DUF1194 domain-containing protein [Akkermansiaceae bacterium]